MTLRAVELFAGAGGLALGTERAGVGFEHVALVEYDRNACETLRLNRPRWPVVEGDVRHVFDDFKTTWRGVDLIAGGPPCQPFSSAGRRRGPDDPRNMFPHAIRAVDQARPRAFLFENVPGLLTWRDPDTDRPYFQDEVRAPLERLGYDVYASDPPLNAADYGVPQTRRRVLTVGFKSGLGLRWEWPAPTHAEDALLWAQWVDGSYWREHGLDAPDTPTALVERVERLRRPALQRWRTVRDAIGPGPRAAGVERPVAKLGEDKTTPHVWDRPARTITTYQESIRLFRADDGGGYDDLTIPQVSRLFGFPDEWRFARRARLKQLGNAVPPGMAEVLMRALAAALS